jgi:hypothetical protein
MRWRAHHEGEEAAVLFLLSVALILTATILVILGWLDGQETLIFVSMACSLAAAAVLFLAVRRGRSDLEPEIAPVEGIDPEPEEPTVVVTPAVTPEPAPAEPADEAVFAASDESWLTGDDWDDAQEVEFPIADYDELSARQILPLLPQLYADELDVVEERERLTKSRPEIIDRLVELRGGPMDRPLAEPSSADDQPVTGDVHAVHVGPPPGPGDETTTPSGPDEPAPEERTAEESRASSATAETSTAKRSATKKSTAKRSTAKKSAAKRSSAKKSAAKKTTAKRSTAKKSIAKRAAKTSEGAPDDAPSEASPAVPPPVEVVPDDSETPPADEAADQER